MATEITYRNKMQITADILGFLQRVNCKPKKKTHMMYACNLSYDQLKTYTQVLVDNGFAVLDHTEYRITPRGKDWLSQYKKMPALSFETKKTEVATP